MVKKIVIAVLAALLAGGLLYGALYIFQKGTLASPALSAPKDTQQYELIHSVIKAAEVKRRAVRTQYKSLKRDSFAPKKSGATSSSEITLNGIMWNEKDPKAMIGDTIVRKGEKVGTVTVVEIKKNSVVLNDGEKIYEVKWE